MKSNQPLQGKRMDKDITEEMQKAGERVLNDWFNNGWPDITPHADPGLIKDIYKAMKAKEPKPSKDRTGYIGQHEIHQSEKWLIRGEEREGVGWSFGVIE